MVLEIDQKCFLLRVDLCQNIASIHCPSSHYQKHSIMFTTTSREKLWKMPCIVFLCNSTFLFVLCCFICMDIVCKILICMQVVPNLHFLTFIGL